MDDRIVFQGNGWLPASVLEMATRCKTSLRASPSETSATVAPIEGQQIVRLMGASGRWAFVEHRGRRGWLVPADQCPNPVTTCPLAPAPAGGPPRVDMQAGIRYQGAMSTCRST